ncbi:MAG: SurA N-terminal domain-containing protein [Gammaproteobacteria bacterium]
MESFRRLIKGWLGKVLLGFVVFVFAIFGAESLMSIATRPKPVAEVNGVDISRQQLDAGVEQERRNRRARLGEQADESTLSNEVLAPQVLDVLVGRLILKQRIQALSLGANDLTVKQMIKSLPQFQQNGKFSQEIFEKALQRSGYSLSEFLAEVRNDYMLQQLKWGMEESFFVTDEELNRLVALQDQARTYDYAVVKPESFFSAVTVSDEDIATYYAKNSEQYRTPERAKFDYVVLSEEVLTKAVTVTEDEIRAAYDAELVRRKAGEQRRASHILISTKAMETPDTQADDTQTTDTQTADADTAAREKIESIKKQLEDGADFAKLAETYSDDPGSAKRGGDLGFAGRGMMVGAFDQALFELKVGQISDVVKTKFGYHLIQLNDIKKPEIPTFDQLRDQLHDTVKQEKLSQAFMHTVDELNQLAYESGDLTPVAEKYGLTIQTSDWVKHGVQSEAVGSENDDADNPESGKSDSSVFTEEAVLKVAFSDEVLKDGFNSDAVLMGETQAVVLHLKEYAPSVVQALSDVKPLIRTALAHEYAHKKAVKQGQEITASLRSGEARESITEKFALQWEEQVETKRLSSSVPRLVSQKVFQMSRPQDDAVRYDGAELDSGFAIIVLKSVQEGKVDLDENERFNMRLFLAQRLGQNDFGRYLEYYKSQSDIELNL